LEGFDVHCYGIIECQSVDRFFLLRNFCNCFYCSALDGFIVIFKSTYFFL
jgi:hypothetical protein